MTRCSGSSITNWTCSASNTAGAGVGSGFARSGSPSAKSCSLTAKMSAKSLAICNASSNVDGLGGDILDHDPLLHRVGDEPLADDRDRVLGEPVDRRVAKVEHGREVIDLAGREQQRRLAVHGQPEEREKPRVAGEEAARLLGDVTALVADAERRALEDRERHLLVRRMRPPLRLGQRLDDDLVDVHVERAREREEDAVGDVLGSERIDALVDRGRLLLVALETDERELGAACEPGREIGQADRPAEQVLAERLR